jgi:hypothetical protein
MGENETHASKMNGWVVWEAEEERGCALKKLSSLPLVSILSVLFVRGTHTPRMALGVEDFLCMG